MLDRNVECIMSPKHDVSEERRDQILEAATIVFSERGIHQTRMADVAEESGVSKGLLYWYFTSKEEIIIAIAQRLFGRELNEVSALAEKDGSARQLLNEFIDIMVIDIARIKPLLPLLYEFFAMVIRQKTAKKIASNMAHQMFADLEKIIRRGIEQGEFREVDPLDTVVAIGAMIEGTYLLWAYDQDLIDIERHTRSGIQLIIDGLVV